MKHGASLNGSISVILSVQKPTYLISDTFLLGTSSMVRAYPNYKLFRHCGTRGLRWYYGFYIVRSTHLRDVTDWTRDVYKSDVHLEK